MTDICKYKLLSPNSAGESTDLVSERRSGSDLMRHRTRECLERRNG